MKHLCIEDIDQNQIKIKNKDKTNGYCMQRE